jgi:hypothetical protein
MRLKDRKWSAVTNNMLYKVFALFVTLILWFSLIGRRDLQVSKELTLRFKTSAEWVVATQSQHTVSVKVLGSRRALRGFLDQQRAIDLDLQGLDEGSHRIPLKEKMLKLPMGLRVLSMSPQVIELELRRSEQNAEAD